ncbi:MAG: substrate-binding domain-containing protein [Brevinematia bacterium]
MNRRLAFGVIFDWIGSPYHTGIISGISNFTIAKDIDTYCFITGRINSPNDWEKKKNLLFYFPKKEKIDGLIITCPSVSNIVDEKELIDFFKIYKDIPIVTLGMSVNDFPSVEIDNENGFKKLLLHLFDLHKVKKIAFIEGPEGNPEARIRKEVFLKMAKEHNIDFKNILFVEGDFSILSGRNATKKIFDEEGYFPEVIISSNDQMALGVLEELEYRKIKVPEQILVTGFDNVDLSLEKGLTTVHQPIGELGYKSAELLFNTINGNIKEKRIVLPTHPIFRTSCGCKEGEATFESSMKIKPLAQETLLEKMNDMGEQLITEFELKKQINIFEESMKFMGVETFFLAFYENPEKPFDNSRMISAVVENKKVALREDVFKTTNLFPEEIDRLRKSPKTYIIQGLFHGNTQIGFFIMNFFVIEGMIYETVRQKLSVALRISSLIGELKDYSQNLEKLVEEKTKDLKRINQKLQEEIEIRKKMEERLKRSEEKFKDIANFLPTIIFETDLNFKIEFINQTGVDFFEIEEKSRLNLLDFIMEEDREKIKQYCEEILLSNNSNFKEFRIVTKKGKKQTLLAKALPIVKNKQIKGLRWSCMDLKSFTNSFLIPEETFFKKYNLTQRQKEVFLLLLEGYKVKDIASKLFITESTVKNHISAIYDEMGVKNKTEFYNVLKDYQLKQFGYESFIFSVLSYLIKDEST